MQRRITENKRSIALIIALGILLITALGDVFVTRFRNVGLDTELDQSRWFEQFLGASTEEVVLQGTDNENRIIVVPIQGMIMTNPVSTFEEDSVVNKLDAIIEDPTIQGMILDIDSPGGTVYESARIWEKIQEVQAKTDIAIYTSMGTVAASGGYYVAAPSDKIFAAAETITGSIGVIADYVNIAGLEEKLGFILKDNQEKILSNFGRSQFFSILIAFIHALAETVIVSVFFFGGLVEDTSAGYFYTVILLVGVGTFIHSIVDFFIAQYLWKGIGYRITNMVSHSY